MEWNDYRLDDPFVLVLAALIPLGIWYASRRVRRGTLRFSSIRPFRRVRPGWRVHFRHLVGALRVLALLFLLAALARPQRGSELSPERSRGIGIMLLVDRSGSMNNEDFRIEGKKASRIDAVKHVAREFIRGGEGLPGRPNDEIGIVAFTGYPVPRAPLTLDHGAVLDVLASLEAADPEEAERDRRGRPLYPEEFQTAIGDAIARGAERLRDLDVKSKVMILLSDGSQTMGVLTPEEGAQIAKSFDVKIYSVGIGQAGVVMQTVQTLFGPVQRPVQSDLDEDTLRRVAESTGGRYFNAASTDALRRVYEEIDRLERSEITSQRFYRWDERFQPLALAGIGLLVVEVLLAQTVFRRIP